MFDTSFFHYSNLSYSYTKVFSHMVLNSRRYSHALKNSAVLLTLQSLALRYHWHRRVLLRGIIDIAESCSAVSLTPQSLAPRYNWHRRVKLSGVIDICIANSWPICALSGVGVGLAREAATLMVGQYFKRRREVVEVMLVASSGLGVTLILSFISPVLRYSKCAQFNHFDGLNRLVDGCGGCKK